MARRRTPEPPIDRAAPAPRSEPSALHVGAGLLPCRDIRTRVLSSLQPFHRPPLCGVPGLDAGSARAPGRHHSTMPTGCCRTPTALPTTAAGTANREPTGRFSRLAIESPELGLPFDPLDIRRVLPPPRWWSAGHTPPASRRRHRNGDIVRWPDLTTVENARRRSILHRLCRARL